MNISFYPDARMYFLNVELAYSDLSIGLSYQLFV